MPQERFTFRLDKATSVALNAYCAKTYRTASQVMRMALESLLKEATQKTPKKP